MLQTCHKLGKHLGVALFCYMAAPLRLSSPLSSRWHAQEGLWWLPLRRARVDALRKLLLLLALGAALAGLEVIP